MCTKSHMSLCQNYDILTKQTLTLTVTGGYKPTFYFYVNFLTLVLYNFVLIEKMCVKEVGRRI